MHKELAVSLGSGDRRIDPAQHLACSGGQRRGNFVAHALMNGRVAYHAAAAIDLGLAGFELWLDQQHQFAMRMAHSHQRR